MRLGGKLLSGKSVIVTGASSERGIGKATATLFVQHGAHPAILDLDQGTCDGAAAEVGGGCLGIACDVRDRTACENAVRQVVDTFGSVDILVNNAAISRGTRIMDVTPEEYEHVHAVNVRGTFFMSQAVIPHMRARGSGNIICLSSVAGQRGGGLYGSSHYAASKAAVLGLAKAMARELAPDNIRVNAVSPSLINTDGSPHDSPERRAVFEKEVPLRRSGTVREVAGTILYLASDLSAYVTGATIDVNGGFHIH
jgi:NAD(P)-dependent dehydrogenase (short-subunit alcohol dehydrogenase family)